RSRAGCVVDGAVLDGDRGVAVAVLDPALVGVVDRAVADGEGRGDGVAHEHAGAGRGVPARVEEVVDKEAPEEDVASAAQGRDRAREPRTVEAPELQPFDDRV